MPDEHCPADAYEGLLGNDDLEPLQKYVKENCLSVCADPDGLKIHLTAGRIVSVNAYPIDAVNALETALYNELGNRSQSVQSIPMVSSLMA